MRLIERMRPVLLRWDNALAVIAIAIPVALTFFAGILWLAQNGYLFAFIGASIGLSGVVALVRLAARKIRERGQETEPTVSRSAHIRADPEWTEKERAVFVSACDFIAGVVAEPLPWADLQPLALEVVDVVARESGRKNNGRLDFTVPEALLLIERVASRYRADIRAYVPMADTLSVATVEKVWRHRDTLQKSLQAGHVAWRAARVIKSLPTAILREIESAIAQGHTNAITGEGTSAVQAILLEEVAAAAVDLYSGRLRFSDSELLDLRVASGETDRARLAREDAPVRIAVAGQVSAGKSSVINALLGSDLAETDVIATTDRPATYETEWNDVPCVLLDLPGLDGSQKTNDAVLAELDQADLVVWVSRANRPARDIDRRVLEEFRAAFATRPDRREPPLVGVVTGIDMLLDRWPFPENLLPPDALSETARIVTAIAKETGCDNPVPVALIDPEWNVDTLRMTLESRLLDALMAQRNRVRTSEARTGVTREITRAGRGVVKGLSVLGPRLLGGKRPEREN